MKMYERMIVFCNRHPLVGPIVWMLSIQYFATQIFAAAGWPQPYNWFQNVISDLGNTACGQYSGRFVCSPYYTWMNSSFIVLGITMIIGASFIYTGFKKSAANRLGFTGMELAGFGTLLVGLFPENTIAILHAVGAFLPFVIGNVSLVILGSSLPLPAWLKWYTVFSGGIALIAFFLYITHIYLGLGQGGMERICAYPQTIWLIIFGMYLSRNRYQQSRQ